MISKAIILINKICYIRYDYEGVSKEDANALMANLNGQFDFFNVNYYFNINKTSGYLLKYFV